MKQKSSVTLTTSFEPCEPKRFVWCWNKIEKKYIFKSNNKSVTLLQPEHGFCHQNGPERDKVLVSE